MVPIVLMIIAFLFIFCFFVVICVGDDKNDAGPLFGMFILFFFLTLISVAVSFESFDKKDFNYSPVPVVMENGNKYIFDDKNIMPPMEIPDGVQIVFKKHKTSSFWGWPLSEKTYVLKEGD